jgi:hypothetical protein
VWNIHERYQQKAADLTMQDNSRLISYAPVSGNLYECSPLFIDELGVLLSASG